MSSFHCLRCILLAFVILMEGAKGASNETHSEEQECSDMFCEAHLDGQTHDAENYLDRLCEHGCEEELETSLRVAHLNYDHVRAAFGSSALIMVVIFAKLCKQHSLIPQPTIIKYANCTLYCTAVRCFNSVAF